MVTNIVRIKDTKERIACQYHNNALKPVNYSCQLARVSYASHFNPLQTQLASSYAIHRFQSVNRDREWAAME